MHDSGEVLGSAMAADDGSVTTEVLVPAWTATGPAALEVVGDSSAAVADLPLDVAATRSGAPDEAGSLVPLLAALGALAVTGAGLVTMTVRRHPSRH